MTYRDTKINDTIYILDKDKMVLQQGRVTATSPHVNNTYNTMAAGQMMRDIAIEVDGKNATRTLQSHSQEILSSQHRSKDYHQRSSE